MKKSCRAIKLIFLVFGLGISAWAPLIPYVKSRLELNDAELGSHLFVFGIGALIAMSLIGIVMNRVGSRFITFLSGIGVLTLLPLLTMASTPLSLGITLFFFGITTGAMNMAMNAQSIDIEKQCSKPILSRIHGWFSVGGLLGVSSMTVLLKWNFALITCTLVVSGLMALILFSQCRHLIPSQSMEKKERPFFSPQVLMLGALCFIAFMAEGAMMDWSAEYLHSHLDYASLSGLGYALFSIAMAFGRFIGDDLRKKWGSNITFQMGIFLASTGFILVAFPFYYLEIVGFILIGLGASNTVPILFGSSGSSGALTLITTCGYLGLLFGPAMIGLLSEATSLSFAFFTIALFLCASGIFGKNLVHSSTGSVLSRTSLVQ